MITIFFDIIKIEKQYFGEILTVSHRIIDSSKTLGSPLLSYFLYFVNFSNSLLSD